MTQKVSHVNKMAEFYVSVSSAPRTTPRNIDGVKLVEITPAPPTRDAMGNRDMSPIPSKSQVADNNEDYFHSADSSDEEAQYPDHRDVVDLSRSHKNRYGDTMETDDEDLLAGMGSGYHGSRTPYQHHDRFAFEHDMGGAFVGSNNVYDGQVEKVSAVIYVMFAESV